MQPLVLIREVLLCSGQQNRNSQLVKVQKTGIHGTLTSKWDIYVTRYLRVSVAVIKHHGQKQGGEERVYLTYTSKLLFIIKGSQDRNS